MDYSKILELEGLQQGHLARINKINGWYSLYEGKQEWRVSTQDYTPTVRVTNFIKKIIDKKARFMFGKEPYFNYTELDGKDSDLTDEKEKLLEEIFTQNKWHSKLLKAKKDCSIGGKVAIKLWAEKDQGLKIIFAPAQEFIATYNVDDVDVLEKVIFFYALNDEKEKKDQRIKKQVWYLENGKCIVDERTYDGDGKEVSVEYDNYSNGLDFIPVVIIQNGGLTGETEGQSDVATLWSNQDAYNRLTSDDSDALKFQMFGQTVVTDADADSVAAIKVSPGAIVDLQTDLAQGNSGRQAKAERLESSFVYGDKYTDTVNRIKGDMYDLMDVPNTSLEQLRGLMGSGKSMRAIYWDLIAVADEEWTEWGPALEQMAEYIFKLIETYNLYTAKSTATHETILKIERYYPILEDELAARTADLNDVIAGTMSKRSYIKKWGEVADPQEELEKINEEKQMEDSYQAGDE